MRRREHQSGFGIVGILLIVLVIGIIGTAGWFVYQHNRVKVTNAAAGNGQTSQTNQQTTTTTTPTLNQNIVKIAELGIQITVPDEIKDLTYQVSTVTLRNGNQATLAMFSTKALTAVDAKCGTSFGPLGSLEKASGQYPTQSQDETNVLDYGQLVKQFPTFYIAAGYPQAGCSENSTALNYMSKFKGDFQAAFSTIQALN